MSTSTNPNFWVNNDILNEQNDDVVVDCICLGTGRFLRSVLVPIMVKCMNQGNNDKEKPKVGPVLIQPRGTSMIEYMNSKSTSDTSSTYEIDSVLSNGEIATTQVPISGIFSLSTPEGKHSLVEYLPRVMKQR